MKTEPIPNREDCTCECHDPNVIMMHMFPCCHEKTYEDKIKEALDKFPELTSYKAYIVESTRIEELIIAHDKSIPGGMSKEQFLLFMNRYEAQASKLVFLQAEEGDLVEYYNNEWNSLRSIEA